MKNVLTFKTFVLWKILRKDKSQARKKKLFLIHLSDKELVSKIHKELFQLNNKTAK